MAAQQTRILRAILVRAETLVQSESDACALYSLQKKQKQTINSSFVKKNQTYSFDILEANVGEKRVGRSRPIYPNVTLNA